VPRRTIGRSIFRQDVTQGTSYARPVAA
jgi:hypothetical protein